MKTLPSHIFKIFVFAFVLGGLQACSTHLPPAGVQAYNQCSYNQAIEIFEKAHKKEKDQLLYDLAILSAAVHSGNNEEVKRIGLRAQQQMWGYEGAGKGAASLVSSEAIRIYKGEPFEKSMASLYLGITYFNEQDYENAKAAFTKAVFAVQTKNGDEPVDFVTPYLLLAKTYLKLNDEDNARITLERVKHLFRSHAVTLEELKRIHTIAFVEMGRGPIKIRTGPGDSLIDWQRQRYFERRATIEVDGKPMETKFVAGDDLTYQARTTNRGGKTAVQATKGALREGAAITSVIAANEALNRRNETAGWIALGAGLFALANQSQADTRQWELLPDRLELIFSTDPKTAGRHEYKAYLTGRFQNDLSTTDQVWYDERNLEQDKIYIISSKSCGPTERVHSRVR